MVNRYLLPIYQKLYDEKFDDSNFEDRLKMQKAIYLLQEMGVPVGDYGFRWYKHGPYSQALLDDMYASRDKDDDEIKFSPDTEDCMIRLKYILGSEEASEYGVKNWAECLASIHYLKSKVLSSSKSTDEVIRELVERKGHLNKEHLNRKAYEYISNIYSL